MNKSHIRIYVQSVTRAVAIDVRSASSMYLIIQHYIMIMLVSMVCIYMRDMVMIRITNIYDYEMEDEYIPSDIMRHIVSFIPEGERRPLYNTSTVMRENYISMYDDRLYRLAHPRGKTMQYFHELVEDPILIRDMVDKYGIGSLRPYDFLIRNLLFKEPRVIDEGLKTRLTIDSSPASNRILSAIVSLGKQGMDFLLLITHGYIQPSNIRAYMESSIPEYRDLIYHWLVRGGMAELEKIAKYDRWHGQFYYPIISEAKNLVREYRGL